MDRSTARIARAGAAARSRSACDGALPVVVAAGACASQAAAARPMRISGPVTNALAAERCREIVGGDDLVEVEAVGDEHELRRPAARHQSLDGCDRRREARSRAHALVRCRGRAVDRDLHALDGERRQAIGGGVVDAAAVGLELERDAAAGEHARRYPSNGRRRAARRRRRRRRECPQSTMRVARGRAPRRA